MLRPGARDLDTATPHGITPQRDEPAILCLLPDRETGARCPPRVEHLPVGPGGRANPLEEIKEEGFDGLRLNDRTCAGEWSFLFARGALPVLARPHTGDGTPLGCKCPASNIQINGMRNP
jgi:hypothetical protein